MVDDKEAVRHALAEAGVKPLPGPFLDFLDLWGNRVEIVSYDNVQFTKAPHVLRGMGLSHLSKNERAIKNSATRAWRRAEWQAVRRRASRMEDMEYFALLVRVRHSKPVTTVG